MTSPGFWSRARFFCLRTHHTSPSISPLLIRVFLGLSAKGGYLMASPRRRLTSDDLVDVIGIDHERVGTLAKEAVAATSRSCCGSSSCNGRKIGGWKYISRKGCR